jgi:hypothetical protein
MANQKNIARLSEIPVEPMKTPDGSAFGGMRQRVGTAVGAKNWAIAFSPSLPEKPLSRSTCIMPTKRWFTSSRGKERSG